MSHKALKLFIRVQDWPRRVFSSRSQICDRDTFGQVALHEKTAVSLQDADKFGFLSKEYKDIAHTIKNFGYSDNYTEKGDSKKHIPLQKRSTRGREPAWYGRKMETFSQKGQIAEAVEVLEGRMLERDRVQPTVYHFTVALTALGKVGYTQKAFKLYNKMKEMDIRPVALTYTALFNACSNSPWSSDCLQKCKTLRESLASNSVELNIITYRAMLKAFAMGGDLLTAFEIVDEILDKGFRLDKKSFSFLMMACITDKQAGFKYALLVWQQMKQAGLKPDIYHYNLLLRATRDCGLGNQMDLVKLLPGSRLHPIGEIPNNKVNVKQLLDNKLSKNASLNTDNVNNIGENGKIMTNQQNLDVKNLHIVKNIETKGWWESDTSSDKERMLASKDNIDTEVSCVEDYTTESLSDNLPSLLDGPESFTSVVSIEKVQTSADRLMLLGGIKGLLQQMANHNTKPDLKTITVLIQTIPSNVSVENYILDQMKELGIDADVDFYNLLMRRGVARRDNSRVQDVMRMISERHLQPNVKTFGCLAMCCRKKSDGLKLLKDMEEMGCDPTVDIFNILVYTSGYNYTYKLELLNQIEKYQLKPSVTMLQYFERQITKTKKILVDQENGQHVSSFFDSDYFLDGYKDFMMKFKPWLKNMEVHVQPHPWSRFREKVTYDNSL